MKPVSSCRCALFAMALAVPWCPPAQAADQEPPKGPFAVADMELPQRPATRYEVFSLIAKSLKLSDPKLFPAPLNPKDAVATPWVDVRAEVPEYNDIEQIRRHGVSSGFPDKTFKGRRPLTRWEWAMVLQSVLTPLKARAEQPGCPFVLDPERAKPLKTQPYADVPEDHWAFKFVDGLRQAGVFADQPEFGGNRPVTRGEVVQEMRRLTGLFRMREAKP